MIEIDKNHRPNKKNKHPVESPASLPTWLLRYRKPLIMLAHITAFASSLMLSFLVIHNMNFEKPGWVDIYPTLLLFFLVVKLPVFGFFKQYRGWWRYVGISDLRGILWASFLSTLIIVFVWFVTANIETVRINIPHDLHRPAEGVCIADMFATIVLLSGLRIIIRLYYEEFRTSEAGRMKRFLIVGAGNAGEALLREMHRMTVAEYEVVGFIDDDPAKKGTNIHGIPILGVVEHLPEVCQERNIEEIAIAMPSASHQQLRRVIQVCEGTKIRFRTVPSINSISRSFSYVYAKPWRMGFYTTIAAVYGAISYTFIRFFAFILLLVTHLFLELGVWTENNNNVCKLTAIWPEPKFMKLISYKEVVTTNWAESVGAVLIYLFLLAVLGLVVSFIISFYFSANTIIYSLMRYKVDNTALEDMYTYFDETEIEPDTTESNTEQNPPD